MKRRTAKEILADSFRELAVRRNVEKITIKEITENCGYSPATFYRHFKDKYDLIAWDYSRIVSEYMDPVGTDYPWVETLHLAANHYNDDKVYLSSLLLHTSGQESFTRYMTEMNYNALKALIEKMISPKIIDSMTDMYIRIYCLGTVQLSCEWILGKWKASPDELIEIYINSLPEPLKPYLPKA